MDLQTLIVPQNNKTDHHKTPHAWTTDTINHTILHRTGLYNSLTTGSIWAHQGALCGVHIYEVNYLRTRQQRPSNNANKSLQLPPD